VPLLVHCLQLRVEQVLQLVGLDLAVDYRAQGVAQKAHAVVVLEDGGVLVEDAALLGVSHVLVERDQAVAPADHEDLVEQFHQVHVVAGRDASALQALDDGGDDLLYNRGRAGDDQNADGDAADHDELRHVQEQYRVAACEHEAA
jgi:hypothetical protein